MMTQNNDTTDYSAEELQQEQILPYKRQKVANTDNQDSIEESVKTIATPSTKKRETKARRHKLIRGATALLGVGIAAVAQTTQGNRASSALVQVNDEYLHERSPFDINYDFVQNHGMQVLPCPCECNGGHDFSLDDTYLALDVRDSYLTRQSNQLANKAESIIIKNEDFETRTINVWRSHESVYSQEQDNLPAALDYSYGISDKVRTQSG